MTMAVPREDQKFAAIKILDVTLSVGLAAVCCGKRHDVFTFEDGSRARDDPFEQPSIASSVL